MNNRSSSHPSGAAGRRDRPPERKAPDASCLVPHGARGESRGAGGHASAQAAGPGRAASLERRGLPDVPREGRRSQVPAQPPRRSRSELRAKCHPNVAEHFQAQSAATAAARYPTLKHLPAKELNAPAWAATRRRTRRLAERACTPRRNVGARTATACTTSSREPPAEDGAGSRDVRHLPQGRARQDVAHLAPPVRAREDELLEAATTRRGGRAQDGEGPTRSRPLLPSARPEAGAVRLRARAGPRGVRVVPRAARVESREAADQKLPNLCWNCHFSGSGHFGSGDNLSTEQGVPVAPPMRPSGYRR